MRSILNLSLPKETFETVKKRVKTGGFESASQYIRLLLEMDEGLISADELLKMSAQADREYRQGKLIKRKSLAELM